MKQGEGPIAGDVRPQVGAAVSNRGLWICGGLLAVAALGLFSALEARRHAVVGSPLLSAQRGEEPMIAAPPSLVLPQLSDDSTGLAPEVPRPSAPRAPSLAPRFLPGVPYGPRRVQPVIPSAPGVNGPTWYPGPPSGAAPSALVPSAPAEAESPASDSKTAGSRLSGSRVMASHFVNPSLTIPQGAVIQAVLETAVDSNRPGFVRAIVSRDVRGFDGSRVLVPRGSRLFGEYKADMAPGQNRAFIEWQKLTRPDGVQIALDSPAADTLGRAGVVGHVNSHFFQRFSGAILQSALDIGVGVATRSASSGAVVVGLPGSSQSFSDGSSSQQIKPTLKVRQGTSVSVFVARDLDFSSAK